MKTKRGDDTPWAAWRRAAMRSSDEKLTICAAGGVVAITAIHHLPTPWSAVLLPRVVVGAFGIWGLAAHDAAERATNGETTSVSRTMCLVVETLAAGVAVVATLAWVALFLAARLGRMIS